MSNAFTMKPKVDKKWLQELKVSDAMSKVSSSNSHKTPSLSINKRAKPVKKKD